MLNSDLRDKALKELKKEEIKREKMGIKVISASEELYRKRKEISVKIIPLVKNYINSIAKTPKEFNDAVTKLNISYNKFKEEIKIAEKACLFSPHYETIGCCWVIAVVVCVPVLWINLA